MHLGLNYQANTKDRLVSGIRVKLYVGFELMSIACEFTSAIGDFLSAKHFSLWAISFTHVRRRMGVTVSL